MAEFWLANADRAVLYPRQYGKKSSVSNVSAQINPTGPVLRLSCGMVEKSALSRWERWNSALEDALAAASAALAAGEHQDAEQRAKAVSAVAKATRDVADLAKAVRELPPEHDDDNALEDLHDRVVRYIEAQRASGFFGPALLPGSEEAS